MSLLRKCGVLSLLLFPSLSLSNVNQAPSHPTLFPTLRSQVLCPNKERRAKDEGRGAEGGVLELQGAGVGGLTNLDIHFRV